MANRTALVMTGGTGGHIFPALAVADALKAQGWTVVFLGAEGGMETRLVPQHGYPLETLAIRGVRGNGVARWLALPWVMLRALLGAAVVIFRHRPDVSIGFGGYTGFPGGLMTRLLWKPLVIHEQNSVAGLTNRLLSRIATRTLFAFPSAFRQASGLVGNPVRAALTTLPAPAERFSGRQGVLRLLVVGGSLGAQVLNETVPAALALLPAAQRPVVIHQAGAKSLDALQTRYAEAGVKADCRAFIDDMAAEYAAADMVICRAGALTIAELAAVGVGSVLVPYPHAVDDHQTGNARYLSDAGAAKLWPQTSLNAADLAAYLATLTRADCLAMAEAAHRQALTGAAEKVAAVCVAVVGE